MWRHHIPVCPSHPWSVVQDGRRVLFFSCTQEAVLGGHLLGLVDGLVAGYPCDEGGLSTRDRRRGSELYFTLALSSKHERNEYNKYNDYENNHEY